MRETAIQPEALYTLFLQAFHQWKDHNIDSPFLHTTLEEFLSKINRRMIFVAMDANEDHLLGMHFLQCDPMHHYAFGSFLAVNPKYKHEGVASRMLKEEIAVLRQYGFRYLKGTTSTAAFWSVRWHLKNGYHITGYSRSETGNTSTYTFRKQLFCDVRQHPSDLLWTRPLAPITARLCFWASYLATNLCKTKTGRLNALGRIVKRII